MIHKQSSFYIKLSLHEDFIFMRSVYASIKILMKLKPKGSDGRERKAGTSGTNGTQGGDRSSRAPRIHGGAGYTGTPGANRSHGPTRPAGTFFYMYMEMAILIEEIS